MSWCPFILVPICLGAHLSGAHLSRCPFVPVPICPVPICPGAHLFWCLFVLVPIYSDIHLSGAHLSWYPFVLCPFVLQSSGVATGGGLGVTTPLIEPEITSYIIETVRTKCIIGEALKFRSQKYDKLSLKIVQKALKWPLQYANFQTFSGGACPRTP